MEWLRDNWQLIVYPLLVVLQILLGNRNANSIIKEVLTMLYRTPDYRECEDTQAQSFSRTKPMYELDTRTNSLVKQENELDIQELINSRLDSCLQKALERLMPDETEKDGLIADFTDTRDDMDVLAEALDVAETWRDKLGLPEDMPTAAIFGEMTKYEQSLKTKLKEVSNNGKAQKSETPSVE